MNELEKRYGKPYINQDLVDKVLKARECEKLHEDDWKVWENEDELSTKEKRYWSELGRSLENFTQEEFAVVTYVALQNYPEMVFQIVLEEYLSNKEKSEKWTKLEK